ncbi:MAG: PD-(D/E)XK nuclease-like domain-containing protein [Paludibacteraceae bacterium]|nr:PD-(D/E)XK nuclease-like domain-containing protein [Paludibacteraceae bacterium]
MESIQFRLSNEEYHHGAEYNTWLSSSQLKDYLVSPKYAYEMRQPENNREQTESMRRGTLFHDCMEFVVNGGSVTDYIATLAMFAPPFNPKTGAPYGSATKAYQEAYQEWLSSDDVSGKTVITQADRDYIIKMASAALKNDVVSKMIKAGKPDDSLVKGPEISFFYEGKTPGGNPLKTKCRPDLLTKVRCIDWKSTSAKSLTADEIGKIIYQYGYGISCAMYQYILYKLTGKFYEFLWVFVSTETYDCVVCGSQNIGFTSAEDLEVFDNDTEGVCVFNPGVMQFRELLNLHCHCIDTNSWEIGSEVFTEPDANGNRIIEPSMPAWAIKNPIKAYV